VCAVNWFYTTWAAGNDTQRSGRGYCGCCRIALRKIISFPDTSFPIGKDTSRFRKHPRSILWFPVDETHNLFAQTKCFLGIVWYAKPYEHVREAHAAETDFPVCFRYPLYFSKRILAYFNDVIEKTNTEMSDLPQHIPVNHSIFYYFWKVDRSKTAWFIGEKRLLAAGVRSLYRADIWCRVRAVDCVNEYDARFARSPCRSGNEAK